MRVVEGPGAPGPRGPLGLPRSELGHPLPDAVTEGAGVRDRGAREGSDPPGRGACLPVLTGRGACWCSAVPHPPGGVSPPDGGAPPQSLLPAVSTRGPRTRKAPGTRVAVPPAAEAGPLRASVSSPVSRVGRWQETDLPPGRWQCGPRADARCLEGKWRRYHWGVAAPPGFRDKQPLKGQ